MQKKYAIDNLFILPKKKCEGDRERKRIHNTCRLLKTKAKTHKKREGERQEIEYPR